MAHLRPSWILILALSLALALGLAGCEDDNSPASPGPMPAVDQEFLPGVGTSVVGIGGVGAYAQTFTAGATGTLTSVDLILNAQGPDDEIRVDIRETTGGSPNLDDLVVLGNRTVTASSLPGYPNQTFVTIDMSDQAIACVAGQTLAIVLIRVVGSGGSDVLWITENEIPEEYTGGSAYQRLGGSGTAWTPLGSDFYFRTRVLPP